MRGLILAMDHEDPAIRLSALESLRQITGKDYGVEPATWRKELQPQIAATRADSTPR